MANWTENDFYQNGYKDGFTVGREKIKEEVRYALKRTDWEDPLIQEIWRIVGDVPMEEAWGLEPDEIKRLKENDDE